MSASMSPTRWPSAASAMARFTATVLFPTPPLPELTAMTRPSRGSSLGAGAGTDPVDWGMAPPGGPWVALGGPAGSTTVIFTPSGCTPGTALTAFRVSRTSVAGPSRESRKVNETRPSAVTARSRIMPAERRSLSSRGFRMRPRAAATCASREGATRLDRLDLPHLGHQLAEPRLDSLAQRDGRGAAAGAGAAQAEQEHPVGFVEVHHFDLAPVGGDVRPEGVQRLFDAFQRVRHRRIIGPPPGGSTARDSD